MTTLETQNGGKASEEGGEKSWGVDLGPPLGRMKEYVRGREKEVRPSSKNRGEGSLKGEKSLGQEGNGEPFPRRGGLGRDGAENGGTAIILRRRAVSSSGGM